MAYYKAKPVTVQAFRYGYEVWPKWFEDAIKAGSVFSASNVSIYNVPHVINIVTVEGNVARARIGDFVIFGTIGDIYCCHPDAFYQRWGWVVEPYPVIQVEQVRERRSYD